MKRSYRVLARLGEGGMATVYLALLRADKGFRKLVALKVLRDQPGVDLEALREMFAHEARVSARCHHRNVVQVHDVCDLDGKPALCMEYLDGQTYRQVKVRATKTGALPLLEQVRILAEAAHGLHHVHTLSDYDGRPLGLVHCDVSPENVFITYDGQVKLLDFGIAQAHGDRPPPPGFRGKLSYLAPELIKGGPVDARADVFALGAMLWEAVSLVPFSGGPAVDDLTKVRTRLRGGEGNIRGVQPEPPEALAAIIDRALALDPEQRFPDAETFANALEEFLLRARPQPSAHSLARLVTPMFERERSKQRVMVDPQLQLADRWDREHESATAHAPRRHTPGPTSVHGFVPMAAAPHVPFAPLPFSDDAAYSSAADTVSPDLPWRLRANSYAVLALVAALGILGGAWFGFSDARQSAQPTATVPSLPSPDSAPTASGASAPEQLAVDAHKSAQAPASALAKDDRRIEIHDDYRAHEPDSDSAACVTTTRLLREDLLENLASSLARDMQRNEAREERHRERRARRRAAQCAAGRTEKCSAS